MSHKLVMIDWLDSCSRTGGVWQLVEDAQDIEPVTCRTVGFVIKDDDHCIVLVGSESDDEVSGDICIPKVCIISNWEIIF